MHEYVFISLIATAIGIVARIVMLRSDYRQYPSSPYSLFSHLAMAAIASVLGAVAVPAFMEKQYTAVTFLTLAATQFREIRSVERESLQSLEETELVERGQAYIEDTAKKFESRNYVAMASSLMFGIFYYTVNNFLNFQLSVFTSLAAVFAFTAYVFRYMKGKKISDIADIQITEVKNNGPLIVVGNVTLINVGNKKSMKIILENSVGILLKPKGKDASVTLSNLGQRQAILHNCAIQLGIRKDVDEPDFSPIARRDPETGIVAVLINCMEKDKNIITDSVARTPVLESAKRLPSQFYKRVKNDIE